MEAETVSSTSPFKHTILSFSRREKMSSKILLAETDVRPFVVEDVQVCQPPPCHFLINMRCTSRICHTLLTTVSVT